MRKGWSISYLSKLEKYKVISLLKCTRIFWATRASVELPYWRIIRTSKRCSKKRPKENPHFSDSFWTSLGHLSNFRIAWNFCFWSDGVKRSVYHGKKRVTYLGISWRYISRNIRSHEFWNEIQFTFEIDAIARSFRSIFCITERDQRIDFDEFLRFRVEYFWSSFC